MQDDGNRRGRGVAVAIDVDAKLLIRNLVALHGLLQDSDVGLVTNELADVLGLQRRCFQAGGNHFTEFCDRKAVNVLSAHANAARTNGVFFVPFGDLRLVHGAIQLFPVPSVTLGHLPEATSAGVFVGRYHCSARTVSKQDGNPAIVVIHHPREELTPNDAHRLGPATPHHRVGDVEGVNKRGTSRHKIKCTSWRRANIGRHPASTTGNGGIWRAGAIDDQIKIRALHARI